MGRVGNGGEDGRARQAASHISKYLVKRPHALGRRVIVEQQTVRLLIGHLWLQGYARLSSGMAYVIGATDQTNRPW